jgi:serine/threonine protein kinase/tetratricopeptide (TPR) repeat protein
MSDIPTADAVEAVFFAALDKHDPIERAAYLDAACAGEPDLRARVERLLAVHPRWGDLLEPSATGPKTGPFTPNSTITTTYVPQSVVSDDMDVHAHEGAVIAGKYTLVKVVGEGGMGSVWLAKQTEPVKRMVAVKLIKAGMDSRQVLARFEAERQALALMDHPNIAKVLDGGLHNNRPYFVMELVKGVPITDYCDQRKLTPRQRLELFVPVCQAIQHAHQKGIIHRDIKPSNVLVAVYDDRPVVKVIDFGVAKATGPALTERTIDTVLGGIVGTPAYMSPEQATFDNLDIDTRSDVYALGVLLYELLVGSPPFSSKELHRRGLLEILRVVREEEPPRPSTKLSSSDALPSLSANRATEPRRLTSLLRNELDWIVMKAIEKDRTRRYETANGFAADVLRHLAGEPVLAHPPSRGYRLKKFILRNRIQVIAAGLVLMALATGLVGTSVGMVEAKRQEGIAVAAAENERQAKLREAERAEGERMAKEREAERAEGEQAAKVEAQRNLELANTNLAFARKGNEILGSVFTGLDPKANYATLGELSQALKDNLKKAVRELDGAAIGDPLTVAEMQNVLGLSFMGLGEPGQAAVLFQKAQHAYTLGLGDNHHDSLVSVNNLANAYRQAGKLQLALPLFEKAFKLLRATLGPDHPDTLTCMTGLASAYEDSGKLNLALSLFEEGLALTRAKLGPDHNDTLRSMNNLAICRQLLGQLDRALPLYEESFKLRKAKLGPDHPDTLTSMNNLAAGYEAAGKPELALPLQEEVLRLTRARLGPDHPHTITGMNNLATAYQHAGKLDLALPLFEDALKLTKARLGLDHPETFRSMNNLALCYKAAGKLDLALPLFEESFRLTQATLGPDHPDTLGYMNNLATGYEDAGKVDLALPLHEEALRLLKTRLGPDHPHTLASMNNLAGTYRALRKLDKALPLYEEALQNLKPKLGPDHPTTLTIMNNLAAGYWNLGQLDKSIPLLEETLRQIEKKLGRQHPDTQMTVANLGVNYKDAGRISEALPLLKEAYQTSMRVNSLRFVGTQLLDGYIKAGETTEGAKLIGELVASVKKRFPPDSPQLASEMASLSLTLLQLRAFADAESLLHECLEIRAKAQPNLWSTFNTQSMLGAAFLGQKKYAEAEPLLLQGYEGLKAREKTIPPAGAIRLPEAIDRLIDFYDATEQRENAQKWRSERAKYPFLAPAPREKK